MGAVIRSYGIYEIPVSDRISRAAILLVAFLVLALLAFQAERRWRAAYLLNSGQIDQMERASSLLPQDAESWDRAGLREEFDLARPSGELAIRDFRNAVRVDPLTARYWVDLAAALDAQGDVAGADDSYKQALLVYPESADVAFSYGNFLLRHGNASAASPRLRFAASQDYKLIPLIVSRTWRSTEDVNTLLDGVLPANSGAYLQALDFFSSIQQGDAALKIWKGLLRLHQSFPLAGTFPLFDELIRENRGDDARRAWLEAAAATGLPAPPSSNPSVLWDGKFEQAFAEGGLGWRWEPAPSVSINFDAQSGPDRSRAVRVDFGGGSNVGLAMPAQYAAVRPNQPYHFQAYVRTDRITTESGPHFGITDPNNGGVVDVLTDDLTGTHPWSPVEADFQTGPGTHFILVRLIRNPSRLFENKITGSVWIADMSIVPLNSARPPKQ